MAWRSPSPVGWMGMKTEEGRPEEKRCVEDVFRGPRSRGPTLSPTVHLQTGVQLGLGLGLGLGIGMGL